MKRFWMLIGGSAILWALVIGLLQWSKFHHFQYNGLDLGIYTQVLWSLSHGQGFSSSIHDPSYLGDHVEVWLLILAPLYRVLSSPLLLLWAQTVVLASSVIPLALLVRQRLNHPAALVGVLLFLVHPLLYNMAMYEFHGLIFVVPLLFWTIIAYQARRFGLWIALLGLIALTREDMPLLVAGWSVLAAVDRRSYRWWIAPLGIALIWSAAAQWMIGSANPLGTYKYTAFYRWLGSMPSEMLVFPVQHPVLFLQHLFHIRNWETVLGLLLTFGFLPLWRAKYLWPLVLIGLQLLLLGADARSILKLHYTAPYLPLLAWAAVETIRRVWQGRIWKGQDPSLTKTLAGLLLVTGVLYGSVLFGPAEWPWGKTADQQSVPAPILQHLTRSVGSHERVLTTFNLLPHLANRPAIYSLNYVHLGRRQYTEIPYTVPGPIDVAVIDWQELYRYQFLYRTTYFQGQTGPRRLEQLLHDNNLAASERIDNVVIYRRTASPLAPATIKIDTAGTPKKTFGPLALIEHSTAGSMKATLSPKHDFRFIDAVLVWEVQNSVDQPLSIRFTLSKQSTEEWSSVRLLGQEFTPALEWLPGQSWQTTYQLALPSGLQGTYQLRAELVGQEGRTQLNRLRSFAPVVTQEKSFGTVDLGSISW